VIISLFFSFVTPSLVIPVLILVANPITFQEFNSLLHLANVRFESNAISASTALQLRTEILFFGYNPLDLGPFPGQRFTVSVESPISAELDKSVDFDSFQFVSRELALLDDVSFQIFHAPNFDYTIKTNRGPLVDVGVPSSHWEKKVDDQTTKTTIFGWCWGERLKHHGRPIVEWTTKRPRSSWSFVKPTTARPWWSLVDKRSN
jgi:hypothetical protein